MHLALYTLKMSFDIAVFLVLFFLQLTLLVDIAYLGTCPHHYLHGLKAEEFSVLIEFTIFAILHQILIYTLV